MTRVQYRHAFLSHHPVFIFLPFPVKNKFDGLRYLFNNRNTTQLTSPHNVLAQWTTSLQLCKAHTEDQGPSPPLKRTSCKFEKALVGSLSEVPDSLRSENTSDKQECGCLSWWLRKEPLSTGTLELQDHFFSLFSFSSQQFLHKSPTEISHQPCDSQFTNLILTHTIFKTLYFLVSV